MEVVIVSGVVERISYLLTHEAGLLYDVKEQVEELKDLQMKMKSFLEDVDSTELELDAGVLDLVSAIRDLAYEAEDVIESFILERAHQDGLQGAVKRFTSIFTKPCHHRKIGVKIKEIKTKLENISESLPRIQRHGPGPSSVSINQQPLRTFSLVEEEDLDIVGHRDITEHVLAQLKTEEDRLHSVVSLVGMGGIGKTTLARRVYNHVTVKRYFDCLAWVTISQQFNLREVLLRLLTEVISPSNNEREVIVKEEVKGLIERLFDVLKEKRYLIVLDDIRSIEDWDILQPAFPRGIKGSKILLTTRSREVALRADPCNSPFELPLLTDEESWELFIRKAFPRNKTDPRVCTDEFEELGKEIVRKCTGLPLTIVVLGGLLATKHSLAEWEMVRRNFFQGHFKGFQPQGNRYYDEVNGISVLSFINLPLYLKPCFLHLGNYPQDWEISKKELVQLWIAEGFISPSLESDNMLMEDLGELFLEELINRNLVQVVRRDYTGTKVKTCQISDVMRNVCIRKAKEEKFLEILEPPLTESGVTLKEPMLRRIAIHPCKRYVCLKEEHPNLRSLFLFQNEALIDLNISKCKSFKLLRVLNLVRMDVYKWHVSSEIGKLHHLRYLRLEGAVIIVLPRAIGKLKNLHTLYLLHQDDGYFVIPDVLSKLERLRHIVFQHPHKFWYSKEVRWQPKSFSKNIETLKYIVVDEKIEQKTLLGLTNIRKLGMMFKRLNDVKRILSSLMGLPRLASLQVKFKRGLRASYQHLEDLSKCEHLSKLELVASIKEDPFQSRHVLNFLPPNIVKLTLSGCGMKQDPMDVLGQLSCLRILKLQYGAYQGSEMICSANGFRVLDLLHMSDLELKKWEIKEGAMPCLKKLHLKHVVGLRMIPEGLKYITTLTELKLISVYSSLEERIKVKDEIEGEDVYKVRHIPDIQIQT